MIRVHDGGVHTTVQDQGRFGLYHLGMPPSGALDDYSFRAANLLVGNDESAAVLEATFSGPKLEFDQDAVIAVTGADLPLALDGDLQALGEQAFNRYPVQLWTNAPAGLWSDPVRGDGLVRVELASNTLTAATCATCHATVRDGVFVAGVDAGGVATGGYASGLAQALVLGLAAAESIAAS